MDLSALTLAQLRYVVAVDNTRSFRAAAEQCNVTQPALSAQVHKLEELLGVALFDRSMKPVVPTARGESVLKQARVALREAERIGERAKEGTGALTGTYRLGVIPTVASTLLPALLPRFRAAHPSVSLVIKEVTTSRMIEQLSHDELDGGIAATPLGVPSIHEVPLYLEAFQVYLSPRHALASHKTVAQSGIADEDVWLMAEGHCFRNQVLHLCRTDRRPAAEDGGIEFESGTFETLVQLVDAGMGITVLPELVVDGLTAAQKKRVRPFAAPVPMREVGLVFARTQLYREIAEEIAKLARSSVPAPMRSVQEKKGRRAPNVLPPV